MGANNLFERFDKILESYGPAVKYAEEHFEELRDREQNAAKKVMTSLGYDLGIACPSLIIHKVVRGNKKGRIIKEIPKGEDCHYNIISYDEEGNPVAVRPYNKWGAQDAKFFFNMRGISGQSACMTIQERESIPTFIEYYMKTEKSAPFIK